MLTGGHHSDLGRLMVPVEDVQVRLASELVDFHGLQFHFHPESEFPRSG